MKVINSACRRVHARISAGESMEAALAAEGCKLESYNAWVSKNKLNKKRGAYRKRLKEKPESPSAVPTVSQYFVQDLGDKGVNVLLLSGQQAAIESVLAKLSGIFQGTVNG